MIRFEHIKKVYEDPENEVFSDFSLHIERGEFVVLSGASGSGKSTLINMLLLDQIPNAGKIYVNNCSVDKLKRSEIPNYRRNIGVIFQDFRLIRDQTVYENINLARIAIGAPRKDSSEKIYHTAKFLQIAELLNRYPDELSGGEQQKVCMARALVNHPLILLADEPTANLDPDYSAHILRLLEIIHNQGSTLLVATQDPIIAGCEKARQVRIEELDHGHMKEAGLAQSSSEASDHALSAVL